MQKQIPLLPFTCGAPHCGLKECARNKNVKTCPLCTEYPCEKIRMFSKSESTLVFDGERMKNVGLEKWINEQEERRRKDFSYDDIRCVKGEIPESDE